MGFKLKAPYQSHNIPVHEVPFSYDNNKAASDGLVAKANDNFSIIVNKNKTHDTKLMAAAMSHEGEHLRQMFGIGKYEPGDLKYGPGGVEFKGKFHDRNSPSFNEADRNLPYEKPAYAAGESFKPIDDIKPENMKDQVAFYSMGSRKGSDEDTVSSTENFGPAKKTWSPISFTNDYGELISPEGEGDDKKVTTKERRVPGGVEIITTTVETPTPKNYKVKKGQPQTKDPSGYLQSLIDSGISREEVEGRQLVSKDKYDLFEYKDKPVETSTTKFIADPPPSPEPPEPDFSYLKGVVPTGTYRGGGGKIWGGEISSTVGKSLRGGKDPMSRPITDEEGEYLFGKSWGGPIEKYYASKNKDKEKVQTN